MAMFIGYKTRLRLERRSPIQPVKVLFRIRVLMEFGVLAGGSLARYICQSDGSHEQAISLTRLRFQ